MICCSKPVWGEVRSGAPVKPNIVLVLADDLGESDLGCYGRHDHRTPHLDRLAKQGMRFSCAYAAQPICSPSRAALMTGKCPARLNLTNYLPGRADAPSQRLLQPRMEGQLPVEETTIAEALQAAGYATGIFGKWHLGGEGFSPREQGFDTVVSPPANTTPSAEEGGKGEYAITAAAAEFVERNQNRPFFCYVPHNSPHIPLAAADEKVAKHVDAFHPVYAAMVETLDDAVGRLIAKVDALGLSDRTIFVFSSDNGGLHVLESPGTPATYNRPFRAGKGFLYEGGLRVPLLVRWPGTIAPGSICETPVVLTDLMPTLLRAAGINPATTLGPLDSEDITPLLRGESLKERTLHWHFPNYTNQGSRPAGAIREGDWKLIEHYEDGRIELFDLSQDVEESKNLASAEAARAESLLGKLRTWRLRVGASMPLPNPDFEEALHRQLYVEQDPSQLRPEATAAATEPAWRAWRQMMNAAIKGRTPTITPATGDIRLHAKNARVHGKQLRYEPEPHKNVLGYWTEVTDWADWEFEVPTAGVFEVEVQQGCGAGCGGAEMAVVAGDKTLNFTVQETGHFQYMILRTIGRVELPAGKQTLAVRAKTRPGVAVVDIRRVVLRPASF